ncbi:hypothetical protein GCM10010112_32550 [Actinoplanes lobatus]|uniref:Uncharacterized protein (DUF1015 family) n=1 Tax=Actinoplanes lobatus TaxID=113568 RepID=A0A7W7MG58_9ACTN|nr:DUF1015 family protein [Actinoplanes lobatus]MBB4748968.1 uncharacterized protein (DUF1015 family) [Actinoplanes lobatus]GGN68320.1 hypothetical protein GCM10010112_32550 [Actinoplanes lobatus]GIE37124.1 hypothetical protein Alo02nite_00220 [Actinoplanes lobatus]
MTVVHPISRAWITNGGTGAQNYDEFADDAEITDIIKANPHSALAVEMPHLAPESLGKSFLESLPDAVVRLQRDQAEEKYRQAEHVVVLYRITAPGEAPAYGLWSMVETGQISTSADEPGLVIRNEDVFISKVRERVALAEAVNTLLSPVLLLQTGRGEELHAALAEAIDASGEPAATDVDGSGRTHAIWPVGPGELQDRLLALAGGGELVVADGNHRSLAAQTGGLERFLAVVTTPASVFIQPYNRLVSELPASLDELRDRLREAGATVTELPRAAQLPPKGTIEMYVAGRTVALELPTDPAGTTVENLDHALVERVLLRDSLGLDPGDKRISYIGGDYPVEWLRGEVDAGRAELAVLIAPVTVEDFVEVNLERLKLPRKSTWFTPKARGGLVLAEIR